MASAKHTPMSKELLANIHRSQLMNGQTNNVHKEAILLVLGGIDGILQHLLTSNAVLHEQQIDSLHLIIANTPAPHKNQQTTITNAVSQRQEDKTDIAIPTLTYTFKDEDSLLFTIFGQENARKIVHVLSGKIVKCLLLLLFGLLAIISVLAVLSVLSWDAFFAFISVFYSFYSVYIVMWILYANKDALKLLFRQFIFWCKIVYLLEWLVTDSIYAYLWGDPLYAICFIHLFYALLLLIIIIFDAINIPKSTKIMISSLAVGLFAFRAVWLMVDAFYGDNLEIYDRGIVKINIPYVNDTARISVVDMCSNSIQILSIFFCKQLISIITNPDQALVIETKPFIEYENNKATLPTMKNLKRWRRATIVGWTLSLLLWVVLTLLEELHIVYIALLIIRVLIYIIGLCVVIMTRSKFHWFWLQGVVTILLIFGVTAVYTSKVSEMDKMDGSMQRAKQEKEGQNVLYHQMSHKETSTKSTRLHVSMEIDDAHTTTNTGMSTQETEMQGKSSSEESVSDQKVSERDKMNESAQLVRHAKERGD
eukprot:195317_1